MNQRAQQTSAGQTAGLLGQIRAGCLRRGWDDKELARRAGVSRTTLYYLKRGVTRHPRAATLNRIAQALELDPLCLNAEAGDSGNAEAAADIAGDSRCRFDRRTNPQIATVCRDAPLLFRGWAEDDWDELYSLVGTGGALTEEGVVEAATHMNRRRETVRRLQIVLETHLAEVAERMVETLFEMTRPNSNLPPPGNNNSPDS